MRTSPPSLFKRGRADHHTTMYVTMECYKLVIFVLLAVLAASSAHAQGDREGERRSLAGVAAFSIDATVEGPEHLADAEMVRIGTLVRAAQQRLQDAALPVDASREGTPNLHIHLNMMQLENGLIAFSVEVDFFQEALLARNRARTSAITWNESVVGFVSPDMMSTIAESALRLVDLFAQDFRTIN